MSPRQTAWIAGVFMLAVYLATSAPCVTFWDSGEFIAAARTLGIPHPPGTPLFVLLLNVWARVLAFVPFAAATNSVSAICTAAAVGLSAAWIARMRVPWVTAFAAICAGAMASAWLNATETEVYAASLALALATIVTADQYGRSGQARWLVLTAYLVALAIPLHASALVATPVVVYLATARAGAQPTSRAYDWRAGASLAGVAICAIAVSRLSVPMIVAGALVVLAGAFVPARGDQIGLGTTCMMLVAAAAALSLLLFLLVRARHDPGINQGNPSTWQAMVAVIGRRQYAVQGVLPRLAPVWLQIANWFEYADWQFGLSFGPTVIPTAARVGVTAVFAALGIGGARWHRRQDRRGWFAVLLLFVCGTLGVITYLNLRAGASFGWRFVPNGADHEARERDYFFVLGFWAWGLWAGMGAIALARRLRVPTLVGVAIAAAPIALNWRAVNRRSEPEASLPRTVARSLLSGLPPRTVLFVAGDNDTYPVWYVQRVERLRPDVTVVTIPLLSAAWYVEELARRDSLVPIDRLAHGRVSLSEFAQGAERLGRPVAAALTVPKGERDRIARFSTVAGLVVLAHPSADSTSSDSTLRVDSLATRNAALAIETWRKGRTVRPSIDPVNEYFLNLLSCPRLILASAPSRAQLASLDSVCNLR